MLTIMQTNSETQIFPLRTCTDYFFDDIFLLRIIQRLVRGHEDILPAKLQDFKILELKYQI